MLESAPQRPMILSQAGHDWRRAPRAIRPARLGGRGSGRAVAEPATHLKPALQLSTAVLTEHGVRLVPLANA